MAESGTANSRLWRRVRHVGGRVWRLLNFEGAHPVQVAVLMYHKIGPTAPTIWWVTRDEFAAQIRALKAYGYEPLTLDELTACRLGLRRPPRKAAIVTFDDAYRDILTEVLPILQRPETAFKATVFVPTDRVGGDNRWDAGADFSVEPVVQHLSWDEIREVARSGLIDFQSHSASHPRLPEIPAAQLEREMSASKAALERELGRPVRHICYPYGLGGHAPHVRRAVRRAGYATGIGIDHVHEPTCRDRWNIRRLAIHSNVTVAHHPARADRYFFGHGVLPDPAVPLVDLREVRLQATRRSRQHCEISATGTVLSPVRDVTARLELRLEDSETDARVAPAAFALGTPANLAAGTWSARWTDVALPESPPGCKVLGRLVFADAHNVVSAYQGDWQPIGDSESASGA